MTSPEELPEAALWRSVARTLQDVIAPGLAPGHELDAAVQLQGLAEFASTRPRDDGQHRAALVTASLGAAAGTMTLTTALSAASELLVQSVTNPADERLAARSRPVRVALLSLLARDTAASSPLLRTFAGHPASDAEPAPRAVPADERQALTGWFGGVLGERVALDRATVISGGHSRRMLRVDVSSGHGSHSFVVRIEQGGTFGTDGTVEAEAMRALAQAGLPVAPVRWVEQSPAHLGAPFFVMDLVAGGSAVDDGVLGTFLCRLHDVHQLDPSTLTSALGPVPTSALAAVQAQVDRWEQVYRGSTRAPVPLLDEAAAWLRTHLAPTGPVVVVHGDPGPGNFLHVDGRITAVTDWEFVHYGDAAEDWSYLATIRGRKLKSASDWYAQLSDALGVSCDGATWRAWEAFNQFKGACANLTALRIFREGAASGPHLLAIGTAVHYRFLRRLADLVDPHPSTP
jgi:aminoglycoside phosphotransferase (APT) family kinase protein